MKVEARYICMDTYGRANFAVTLIKGLIWKTETRLTAFWDRYNGWRWYTNQPITDDTVRVALNEAAVKVGL